MNDGFNDVEPDWPAKKPEKSEKSAGRRDLRLRGKLGPDGWRRYLREVRKSSKKSLEGPEEVPLEYRGERPTFNFPIYISSRTKDNYKKRYEAREKPQRDDPFEDET